MVDAEAVERISARVSFFESSLNQLKKDLPKYIANQADSKSVHSSLPKGLRAVASTEPHSALQYFLFLYAKKQEELFRYQEAYTELAKDSKELLDSWEKKLITPMKVLIQDHDTLLKKKKQIKQASAAYPGQVLASSINGPLTSSVGSQDATQTAEALTPQPIVMGEVLHDVLPIHAKLFEKHRVENIKALFRNILWKEITYHARCLEAYSHLLECLDTVEDVEDSGNQPATNS